MIEKGARYGKIMGDFGEQLVCHWLSRSGFEVCLVDHTGMDVIAYNPRTKQRLGISVKARTRSAGKEQQPIYIFVTKNRDRQKLLDACEAFHCEPWIAAYSETETGADLYLTSLRNYDRKYRSDKSKAIDAWNLTDKQKREYATDPEVRHIRIEFKIAHWWGTK